MTDLTYWQARINYAQNVRRNGPMEPTVDHLTLLAHSNWCYSDMEYGAAEMDGKRPYGNGDVDRDLARLLPHLSEQDRIRVHCELPAVLTYITRHLGRHNMADDPTGAVSVTPGATQQGTDAIGLAVAMPGWLREILIMAVSAGDVAAVLSGAGHALAVKEIIPDDLVRWGREIREASVAQKEGE